MRKGKLMLGLFVVVATVVGSLATYRWVKRAFREAHLDSQPHQNTGSTTTAKGPAPIDSPPLLIAGTAMGQAFRTGQLPAPLPQPQGTPEEAAAKLAKRVVAADDQSTAALLTALQMSGFSVRADDGSIALESVNPGQGIVIDAWEAAALAKIFGDGMQVRFTDFGNALASSIRPLKDAPLPAMLLTGLRADAESSQPTMRFWADFIIELGRRSAEPYDLLAPDLDPGKVTLDGIQISLILRRLAADVLLIDGKEKHGTRSTREWDAASQLRPASFDFERSAGLKFDSAVWHPDFVPNLRLVQEGGGQEAGGPKAPCSLKELESQILDMTAYGSAKGFDKIIEQVAEHWEAAEKYGAGSTYANDLLSIIKLIVYYACLETDVTMSGDPPLVRSKSIYTAGEKRTLTSTVRENIGKWQTLNCTRIALNAANLDLSLPNDGPIAGVKTQWVLTSGGLNVSKGSVTYPIVEFVFPEGTPTVQNATGPISDASAPKTDEEGHTHIDIEGTKQREQLSSPMPIMEQAEVRFTVALKPVTMSQDLIDAVGQGVLSGKAGFVGAPVEMLLRANIAFSKALRIPVKDWQSCDGGWGGNITYTTNFSMVTHSQQGYTQTFTRNQTTIGQISLRGNADSKKGWSGDSMGTFTGSFEDKNKSIASWPPNRFSGGSTITADETTAAAGGGPIAVSISSLGDNQYRIGPTTFELPSVTLWHQSCSGDCKGKLEPDRHSNGRYSAMSPPVTTQEDPNRPGELHGSTTVDNSPNSGAATTINWNLTQCKDRQ